MVQIRRSVIADIDYLKSRLRSIDNHEIHAATGMSVEFCLEQSFQASVMCWTACEDNVPFAIGGCTSWTRSGTVGFPWMVATNRIRDNNLYFARQSRRYIRRMLNRFRLLLNFVHSENTESIRWLKWNGFILEDPEPYGPFGEQFIRFWKRQEPCV